MKIYRVMCGKVDCGIQYAESIKEAIKFTRMEMFATGSDVPEGNWYCVEVCK